MLKKLAILVALSIPATGIPSINNVYDNTNLACLASNIYHEARGEPELGQLAVAKVTLNRVDPKNRDICQVVFAKYQFSWTIKNKNLKHDYKSLRIAEASLKGGHELDSFKATHFHTTQVSPHWAKSFKRLRKIGNHIFYEERKI
jgi:N-acetylmuramoyl-L-alanine amidase